MVISTAKFSFVQLDDEAVLRRDQPSFHWFAEGQHSDVRGQVYSLNDGEDLRLPDWPSHVFIVVGINGTVEAQLEGRLLTLRAHAQLVLLPGTICKLRALSPASVEVISFLSSPPRSAKTEAG